MSEDEWLVIPNWWRFQHYGLQRPPKWIKNYAELLDKDEYVALNASERGILHSLWLAYAKRRGVLRRCDLASATGTRRIPNRHLGSLCHAGFIDFSASKPEPFSLSKDLDRDIEKNSQQQTSTVDADADDSLDHLRTALTDLGWTRKQIAVGAAQPKLAAAWIERAATAGNPGGYAWAGFASGEPPTPTTTGPRATGYRRVRGSHGEAYVADPNGTDPLPPEYRGSPPQPPKEPKSPEPEPEPDPESAAKAEEMLARLNGQIPDAEPSPAPKRKRKAKT